jgi:hypothetical protein
MVWKTTQETKLTTLSVLTAPPVTMSGGELVTTLGFYAKNDGGGGQWLVETTTGSETWVTTGLGFDLDVNGRLRVTGDDFKLAPLGLGSGVEAAPYGLRAGALYVNTVLLQTLVTFATGTSRELHLPGGTYYTDEVTIPARVTVSGHNTDLQLVAGGTRAVFYLLDPTDTTIRRIRFHGNLVDEAAMALSSVTGTQRGIYWNETTAVVLSRIRIEDCDFFNFDFAGIDVIAFGLAAGKRSSGPKIIGCTAAHCAIGIHLDTRAEYLSVIAFGATRCFQGARVDVGNNIFTGCHFDENVTGFELVDGTNSGHGSAVGCSFNHNTVTSIKATSITSGFAFVGCQVFDGVILLTSCAGFDGCNFGEPLVLRFDGGSRNSFSDTFYTGAVTTAHNYNGHADNTVLTNVFNGAGTLLT